MPGPLFSRVLVGWDGSAGATAGLRLALQLTATDGGRVSALAVLPGFAHVEDAEDREQAGQDVRAPLRESYDAVLADAELVPGQSTSLEFTEAIDVAGAFDEYAATHPIGLVVVGLHGREGLLHPKMGHVASHAVRISRCPVLVVPDPGHHPAEPGSSEPSKIATLFHPFRYRSDTA